MNADLDLTSVQAKLTRAQFHLNIAKEQAVKWLKTCPYQLVSERNSDFTELRVVIRTNGVEPPLVFWSLIIGDCLGNLRSALDHLVYAIAVKEAFPNPPLKADSRYFVIADSPKDFEGGLRKIDTLSEGVQKAIESVQPYNRPHALIPPPLSILRVLSNTDKHKLVRMAAALPKEFRGGFTSSANRIIGRKFYWSRGPLIEGAEVAVAISSEPDPDMTLETGASVGFCIAIWTGICSKGATIDPDDWIDFTALLEILIQEVAEVIGIVARAALLV
jgi:hypothetical protein